LAKTESQTLKGSVDLTGRLVRKGWEEYWGAHSDKGGKTQETVRLAWKKTFQRKWGVGHKKQVTQSNRKKVTNHLGEKIDYGKKAL